MRIKFITVFSLVLLFGLLILTQLNRPIFAEECPLSCPISAPLSGPISGPVVVSDTPVPTESPVPTLEVSPSVAPTEVPSITPTPILTQTLTPTVTPIVIPSPAASVTPTPTVPDLSAVIDSLFERLLGLFSQGLARFNPGGNIFVNVFNIFTPPVSYTSVSHAGSRLHQDFRVRNEPLVGSSLRLARENRDERQQGRHYRGYLFNF